jgi:peptidoglycan glycosyltransferase
VIRQIRRLGITMLVLYGALFIQLNVVQVVRADHYNDDPRNVRAVKRDFDRPRGQIVSSDGAVLARSVADPGEFKYRREYPEHDLFAQVTGFFSFTYGSEGVEKTYNADLAGRKTDTVESLIDLFVDDEHTNDVLLTVDKRVQQVARDTLGDRRGSVVAIDPRDGAVLALWSFPSFDPQGISQPSQVNAQAAWRLLNLDANKPLLPRAYRETFFPGSTFKIVTASAGLTSGEVTPEQPNYPHEKEFTPPQTNRPLRNFGGETCGGTLLEVFRISCNTAFAHMGLDVGAEALIDRANAFGFGEKPPLDLPAVARSPIPEPSFFEQNVPLIAQTAIGQNTVAATPLEMALVAAAIANDGVIMTPHVLKEVRDDEGALVRRYRPVVWRTAVTPDVADTVREAMTQVVQRGTATRLAVPGVPTAGKTGTAQIGNGKSHAWIVGFAPADAPRVAIAVIVESQSGNTEATGGRVAAPIGQKVLEAALNVVATSP